jgi:murein DD-endopeptidase MepM/ murein hydrolase activator NlpD
MTDPLLVLTRRSRDGARRLTQRPAATILLVAALAACTRPRLPVTPYPAPTPESPALRATADRSADEDVEYLRERHLVVPVANVRADQITDSFDEPREGSRRHRAIDILAPRGTPVLAADDGKVLRVSWNNAGGNTVYTVDPDSRLVYYYAHLDRYRDSLVAGMPLLKGDTIGFVGTTGNAPKDIPHLHFQVMRMPRDGKYWNGEAINPFAALRAEAEHDREGGSGKKQE